MKNFLERRRTFPGDVRIELTADPFVEPKYSKYMYSLKMRRIVVDEIFTEFEGGYAGSMISIRSTESDQLAPMVYVHDGYEMDEDHYLHVGCTRSMNPDYGKRHPNCGCDNPEYL